MKNGGEVMPREPSEKRKQAFELYQQNDGKLKLRDLARILEVPEKTISGWKSKDCWDKNLLGVLRKKEEKDSEYSERGEPQKMKERQAKNKNPTNNKVGAPKGNKNNFKHGIYERLVFESLSEDEKEFAKELDIDEKLEIRMELRQCDIHIARIMKRLKETQDSDLILKYEDSIQKFRRQKMKCIEVLLQLEHNNAKLELEILKTEATILTAEEEKDNSNLIQVLNEKTEGMWKDE